MLSVMLAGCGSRSSEQATATPAPVVTPAATATPRPQPTATPTDIPPTRVEFGADNVHQSFNGELVNGATDFVFDANAGQRLSIELGAADADLTLALSGADGTQLKPAVAGANRWAGILPTTQAYHIQMRSPRAGSGYALTLTLVDGQRVDRSAEPVLIALDAANPRAVMEAAVEAGAANRYLLYVEAGQTLSVEAASAKNNVLLAIEGATDGQTYKSEMDGAAAWNGVLPVSQEYVISVIPTGARADYSLAVLLDTATSYGSAPPERVVLEAGADAVRLDGVLDAGGGPRQYALALQAGQLLSVVVHSSGAPIQIAAADQAGQRWVSEATDGLASELTVPIPRAGNYIVTLSAPLAAGETRYQATLLVQ
ncbi:MAG: hypothetical protein R2911_10255 [Caldilineaceae bacterium]